MVTTLDNDSQGLVRLDRTLAKLLAEKGKSHQIFAMRFAQYTEACHNSGRSPKGRVYLAMIAQRFRLDRSRGKTISLLHLYSIQLHSFKLADIQDFLNRVRYVLGNLHPDEILDRRLMYDWLWEKFKNWHGISNEARKIRKARDGSRKRTWKYLWNSINRYLDFYHEDSNQVALSNAITGEGGRPPKTKSAAATTGDGSRKSKKEKKKKKDQNPDSVPAAAAQGEVPAAAAKGKGKGKDKDKGKGKGNKGDKSDGSKGKGKDKGAQAPGQPSSQSQALAQAQSARDKA
ncbi:MAG: hypothetical protein VX560_10175, partial [SAR324 cluster bacterium]|nr:hypothetical protein [SAR324 cluster bacterium]